MSQAPHDAGGADFGYGPGERSEASDRPRDAASVLRSIWGDEYEAPRSRPEPELDDEVPELPLDPDEGLEARIRELSARVEHLDRTLRAMVDRLGAVEAQSRATADVSAEVAGILRELLKPRPVET